MLIIALCPRCQTKYQVQETLRGKSMRCPSASCKHVFIVGDSPPPSTSLSPASPEPSRSTRATTHQSGSVGDMIPLLPLDDPEPARPETMHVADVLELVESVESQPLPALEPVVEPGPSGARPPTWMDAPPPIRRGASEPVAEKLPAPVQERKKKRETARSPVPAEEPSAAPREGGHHSWAPPPVRRGPSAREERAPAPPPPPSNPQLDIAVEERDHEPAIEYETVHAPRGRWAKWVILPLTLAVFIGLGVGGYFVYLSLAKSEERLAKEAHDQYQRGLFRDARDRYDSLVKNFQTSDDLPFYKFRLELCDIRHRVSEKPESPGELLDHIEQLIKDNKKDPLLAQHGADIGDTLIKLLLDYCEGVAEPTDEEPLKVLKRGQTVVKEAKGIKLPKGSKDPDWSKLDGAFTKVSDAVARMKRRKEIIKRLEGIALTPSYPAILEAKKLLRDEEPNLPGLSKLPEVQKLIASLFAGHKDSVRFVLEPARIPDRGSEEEAEPAILFDPIIKGAPGNAPAQDPIVLALGRGVLFALKQSTGKVKWARRVGIDTTALPVRVPASLGSSERILVLSSDTSTLTAYDVNGSPLWHYRLGTPSLGTPVVVDQRAYLATYSGEVHEIELVTGKLLGRYLLGQPLTLGGTPEPGTHRVFFPAAEGCIYVLDVKRRTCDMILYTSHPGGSLRGEPIVVAPEGDDRPGFLVLNQTNGLDAVQLRVFSVPLNDGSNSVDRPMDTSAVFEQTLDPKVELEGWTWFPPYHDPEKLVMLSDMGMLGLFGVRQHGNDDKPLFPLLPGGSLPLGPLLGVPAGTFRRAHGRAEVAQVQGNDLWVLASDRLQRLRLAWGQADGPRVVNVWKDPLQVGSPLHRSQTYDDRNGLANLVTVTRPARRSTCWATSVSSRNGDIHWRRQLGLVCARSPVAVTMPDGNPLFLALDQGGALLCIDPQRYKVQPGVQWLFDSDVFVADSLEEDPRQEPAVLPAEDGKSVYVVCCPRGDRVLVVRHVKPAVGGRRFVVIERKARLPAPMLGTPAVVGTSLLVPMANGVLCRLTLPLPAEPSPESAFNSRSERAPADAPGHIVALGGDRFLTTDGGRGLTCWEWPAGANTFSSLPDGRMPTLALSDRVVSLPVRLPGLPVRFCVADAGGRISLLVVTPKGELEIKKTWSVGGVVTTGPFIDQGGGILRIGAVVERSRLVWIDPAGDVLWSCHTKDDDPIVGQPRVIDNMIVVAYQSGLYVALDPKTGNKLAPGYRLRGSIAPVASPVAFSKDRLLAPLSDGSVMLLSMWKLVK